LQTLYDSVFTQYGPFYFETMRFLFAVASVEVGHDAGRIVTLAFWIAAALALGAGVVHCHRTPHCMDWPGNSSLLPRHS